MSDNPFKASVSIIGYLCQSRVDIFDLCTPKPSAPSNALPMLLSSLSLLYLAFPHISSTMSSFFLKADHSPLHAPEKATDSYFTIFQILIRLADDNPSIIRKADSQDLALPSWQNYQKAFPNLWHLLVAISVRDGILTQELSLAVIKEAILRNVVWMLDRKDANLPRLSYLELSLISDYRLQTIFQASLTSYRLLIFVVCFRKIARISFTKNPLSLEMNYSTKRGYTNGTKSSTHNENRCLSSLLARDGES